MTPWAVPHQASLSMGFSRHEHWGGLPFPSPGDLPDPGIEPAPFMSSILAGSLPLVAPGKPLMKITTWLIPLNLLHSSLEIFFEAKEHSLVRGLYYLSIL